MAHTAAVSIPLHSEQLGVSRGMDLLVSLQHSALGKDKSAAAEPVLFLHFWTTRVARAKVTAGH